VKSRGYARVVRGIYAEWGRGNFRAGTELYDPNVVLVLRPEFPDAGVYLGRDRIREYMQQWLVEWTDASISAEEFLEFGDTVAVAVHQQAIGRTSGAPVSMRYWQLWTFRGASVLRIESVQERSEVVEAADLASA
jgi:ketosteroid isomerase-like protein